MGIHQDMRQPITSMFCGGGHPTIKKRGLSSDGFMVTVFKFCVCHDSLRAKAFKYGLSRVEMCRLPNQSHTHSSAEISFRHVVYAFGGLSYEEATLSAISWGAFPNMVAKIGL